MLTPQQLKDNTENLCEAALNGDAKEVRRLIPLSEPKSGEAHALSYAAFGGHMQCLELLFPVSNPQHCESEALYMAVCAGHRECTTFLLPHSDPIDIGGILHHACTNGHLECLDLLLPATSLDDHIESLKSAVCNNHIDAVKYLWPHVQSWNERTRIPLALAVTYSHTHIIDFLYPLSDPLAALHLMFNDTLTYRNMEDLEQHIANHTHHTINSHIGGIPTTPSARKM